MPEGVGDLGVVAERGQDEARARTDGVGQSWNEEAEQLFQELQTLFAKTYGEGLYAA